MLTRESHCRALFAAKVLLTIFPSPTVFMDSWYPTREMMLYINSLKKFLTVRSKVTVWGMIPAPGMGIAVSIRWKGMIYHGLLDDFRCQQRRKPSIRVKFS